MKLSMLADFRILKNNGGGKYVSLNDNDITSISIGGFRFNVNGMDIPFDWTASSGTYDDRGCFSYQTGYGWTNDFELDDCFDEEYEELGIKREDISAPMLAFANHIEDFYMNFIYGNEDCETGYFENNNVEKNSLFKLELLRVSFEDIDTGNSYSVRSEVLDAFNKGEKIVSLDNVLSKAIHVCEELNKDIVSKDSTEIEKE